MPQPEMDRRPPDCRAYQAAYERAWRQYSDQPSPHHLHLLLAGEEILTRELLKLGKFELGLTVMTPGARDAMVIAGHVPLSFCCATSTATGASCVRRVAARTSAPCGWAADCSPRIARAVRRSYG